MTLTPGGRLIRHGSLTHHVHDCPTPLSIPLTGGGSRAPKTGDEWQCNTCLSVYTYTLPGTYHRGGWLFDQQPTVQLPELPDPRGQGGPP